MPNFVFIAGTLGRLRRDRRGNTLALAAASLLPIMAMVGSGLDASRTYLVKSRLQSACDAGVLATRKVMDGSGTLSTAAKGAGEAFFDNNFPDGLYATTNRNFDATLDAAMQVVGVARVRVPMSLMAMFNYEHIDLTANCSSRLDITNTDVMFVLDTTGSMLLCPDGKSTCDATNNRMFGLQAAVTEFAKTLNTSAPANARIRFGFVPYSSSVNVGGLLAANQINSRWTYQSRVARFETNANETVIQTWGATLTEAECTRFGANWNYPSTGGATSPTTTDANGFSSSTAVAFRDWGATGTRTGTSRTCRRTSSYVVTPTAYKFSGWTYGPASYDVSLFKDKTAVPVSEGDPPANYYVGAARTFNLAEIAALPNYVAMGGVTGSHSWDGCIEERNTVASASFTAGEFPFGTYDLDLETPATDAATSWRAAWPQVQWDPTGSPRRLYELGIASGWYSCPTAARKLAPMTTDEVTTYVKSLRAHGGTYHDVGMIWGARLMSPVGVFSDDNKSAPNKQPISRNIIFMTDGDTAPGLGYSSLYGIERLDKRVTGTAQSEQAARHNARYVAMCNTIRNQNVRVYVVGFGQSLTTDMKNCADPEQAYEAKNAKDLRDVFSEIATKIARLRLSR